MKRTAEVLKVLIASPSDVSEEREAITNIIHEWNGLIGDKLKVILQPIRWETHAIPTLGNRPQEILNNQFVREADILIGVFWTRIGTPTGVAESGTMEEIEEFKKCGKPVMLYFSERGISPSKLDVSQYEKLNKVKEKFYQEGIVFTYDNVEKLNDLIFKHLTRLVGDKQKNTDSDLNATIEQLEKLNKRKSWGELNEFLVDLQGKKEYEDAYNFFYGRLLIYNPHLNINGPEPFLNSISGNSQFYMRGQRSLLYYFYTKYQDSAHPQLLKEVDKIAENSLIHGKDLIYYYFLKLKTIDVKDFESCELLYNTFIEKCTSLHFDFVGNRFNTMTFSSEPVLLNLQYPFILPTINFYFLVHLFLKAHNKGMNQKKEELFNKLKLFYKQEQEKKNEDSDVSTLKPFQFEFRNFFYAEDEYFSIMRILNSFDQFFDTID